MGNYWQPLPSASQCGLQLHARELSGDSQNSWNCVLWYLQLAYPGPDLPSGCQLITYPKTLPMRLPVSSPFTPLLINPVSAFIVLLSLPADSLAREFPGAAVTKSHKLSGFHDGNVLSHYPGGQSAGSRGWRGRSLLRRLRRRIRAVLLASGGWWTVFGIPQSLPSSSTAFSGVLAFLGHTTVSETSSHTQSSRGEAH